MHTIFQTTNKQPSPAFIAITIIILLATRVGAQDCTQLIFNTNFSRCQIVLDQCQNTETSSLSQQNTAYYKFKSCKMSRCTPGISQSNCTNPVVIGLEEDRCYWSCCKSKIFETDKCDKNNLKMQAQANNMNGVLAIVLTSCALILIVALACFIVKWLKCFKKQVPVLPEPQAPVWTKNTYTDRKCNICEQYGSVIETTCRHFFHLKCYKARLKNKMGQGNCPSCEQTSKKFRLWCDQCHQRCIKILAQNMQSAQQLQLFFSEAKKLHVNCSSDIQNVPKTDVRLTSSSSD